MPKLTGQDFSLCDAHVASFRVCATLDISAKIPKARKVKMIKKRWTEFLIHFRKILQQQRGKIIIQDVYEGKDKDH